ncbi:hypothetical protein J3R83DRAFT_13556 [Lanmaoa asiatica]|nr:hypothetical protein J3R83DRAFT_13556 [Lanmaoa asiatica]
MSEQRKYIDLIHQASSKWVNWDPPIQIQVGAYGTVDKETGDLRVEGNIYDPEFQRELDNHGVNLNLANYPPQEGPVEDDFVVSSRGAKHQDMNADKAVCVVVLYHNIVWLSTYNRRGVASIANACVKGQWLFERGKRDAVLIMHSPRQIFLPPDVILEPLYKVDKLIDKWLVTSIHVCPAYSMYLSDKCRSLFCFIVPHASLITLGGTAGDKVSLALVAQAPVAGVAGVTAAANGGFTWSVDAQTGLIRKACDQTGNYSFTPLYSLRRPIKRFRRFIRDTIRPDPTGDNLWFNDSPPWDPLDEDGEEDFFDPSVRAVDPFKRPPA